MCSRWITCSDGADALGEIGEAVKHMVHRPIKTGGARERRRVRALVTIFSCLFALSPARTAIADPPPDQYYGVLSLGGFVADETPGKLTKPSASWLLAGSGGYRFNSMLAVELEFRGEYATYGTTPIGVSQNLSTYGVVGSAVIRYPLKSIVPWINGGVGLYSSALNVPNDTFAPGAAVTFNTKNNSDVTVGTHVGLGVDVPLGAVFLRAAFRKLWLNQTFGYYSDGRVDVGGETYTLGVGRRF